jgi:hypothetical protein
MVVSGANRTDMKQLADLLDAQLLPCPLSPAPADPAAGPQLCLDRGDAAAACRETAAARGHTPHIPPEASAAQPLPPPGHPDRHPPRRRVVEACHRWFNRSRRLLVRREKTAGNDRGLVQFAACLIV